MSTLHNTRIMLEHLSGGVSMKRRGGKRGGERKKGRKKRGRKKEGDKIKEERKKDAPPGIEPKTFRMVGQSSNR